MPSKPHIRDVVGFFRDRYHNHYLIEEIQTNKPLRFDDHRISINLIFELLADETLEVTMEYTNIPPIVKLVTKILPGDDKARIENKLFKLVKSEHPHVAPFLAKIESIRLRALQTPLRLRRISVQEQTGDYREGEFTEVFYLETDEHPRLNEELLHQALSKNDSRWIEFCLVNKAHWAIGYQEQIRKFLKL